MRYEDIPTTPPWPDYVALCREVGGGFHPDTPSDGYDPPLGPELAERLDRIVGAAADAEDADLYEVGIAVLYHDYPDLARRVH